ncbi:hypothetical protein D3C80_2002660 [compost metagenome]
MTAETVAAVNRTAAFYQQQGTVAILVQQPRHHAALFIQRIGGEAWGIDEFCAGGEYLAQQRVIGITGLHTRGKGSRHA